MDWLLFATLTGPVVGGFATIVGQRVFERRARLITYLGHASAHTLRPESGQPGNPVIVHTHEVVLMNQGRRAATNVRVSHNVLPSYNVFPDVPVEVERLPGGAIDLVFASLVPGEQVTVSYLYYPPTLWHQINGQVRHDDGMATFINVLVQRQYPAWFNRGALALVLLGLAGGPYLIYQAGAALVSWLRD